MKTTIITLTNIMKTKKQQNENIEKHNNDISKNNKTKEKTQR